MAMVTVMVTDMGTDTAMVIMKMIKINEAGSLRPIIKYGPVNKICIYIIYQKPETCTNILVIF